MSARSKLIKKVLSKLGSAAEKARLKGTTYKPATTKVGPSGKPRKISGRTEKAVARKEAKDKTAKSMKAASRNRKIAGSTAVVGASGGTAAKLNSPKSSASAGNSSSSKKTEPKNKAKAPVDAYSYSPGQSTNARAAISAAEKAKKNKKTTVAKVKSKGRSYGKSSVGVGGSVVRNKDGSIKKIKAPTGAKPKSKYARMTTSQIVRLKGKEAAAYKRWKKSQKK